MNKIDPDIYKNIDQENFSVEITTKCNNRCVHCFARSSLKKESELAFSTIKDILKEGYETGYRNLHITGGEPFLHKDIFKIFDLAKKIGYKLIYCNTDGSFFIDKLPSELLEFKNYLNFFISLHGNEEIHNKIRGTNNWHIIQQGIRNGLSNGLKITIYSSVGKSLLNELTAFISNTFNNFPAAERITLIQMQYIKNNNFDLSSELLNPTDFINLVKLISLLTLNNYTITMLDNSLACVVAEKLGLNWINTGPKIFRTGRLFINANKEITFNHSIQENYGKYKPGILSTILSSEKYLTSLYPDKKICPQCKHLAICRKNNMIKPTKFIYDLGFKKPYCQRTLNLISN